MHSPIRILLVDDHKIVREGLRSLLEGEPGFEVVAEASDGRTAVDLAREKSPHVVVMDIAMPHLNGIEATRQVIGANRHSGGLQVSVEGDGAPTVAAVWAAWKGVQSAARVVAVRAPKPP